MDLQPETDITSQTLPVYNPATGELIAEVQNGGAGEVDAAVARARATFDSKVWRGQPGPARAKVMWKIAEVIEANYAELAALESKNNGMPESLASYTILGGAEAFRYYAGWVTKIHGQQSSLIANSISGQPAEYHAYTRREPMGVAGLITPWNVPISMACNKLAPALAAGCSVVLKPAEETPLTTIRLAELLLEAGLPNGVVNVVTGYGETAGAAIAAHDGIAKVGFTGSTEVGKLIVKAAAGNLKKVTLELGGKAPIMIFDDADLSKAIPGAAMGIFANSGQACIVGSRLFVHRKVYDQVVEGIAAIAQGMVLGNPADPSTHLGPLISAKQANRVMGFIEEGKANGCQVVTGGARADRPGHFVQPTVMTGVTPDMRLYKEEIFGPVLAVIPFEDEAETIKLANDTPYGLAAGVWTKDISRAHRIAAELEAGSVWINCQLATDLSMPFGGYKQSGWGRENGFDGVESYLQTKSVFAEL